MGATRRRFRLVPVEPREDQDPAPSGQAPRRGLMRSLGALVLGWDFHRAAIKKALPTGGRLKAMGAELVKASEVLGQKYMPKASSRRLKKGPSLGALLVLLIAFLPCIYFTTRTVVSVLNRIQGVRARAAQELEQSRKERQERSQKRPVAPAQEGNYEAH